MSSKLSSDSFENSYQQLISQWESVQHEWRDKKSQDFNNKHMADISARVNQYIQLLENLADILQQSRHCCDE